MDFEAAREAMVEGQVRPADVTRRELIAAMRAAPREAFVPRALRELAYADMQPEIAPGRVLLDPRALARVIQAAELRERDLVLDVGCGTGYSTLIAARLAAFVVALEQDERLAEQAAKRLAEFEVDNATVERGTLAAGAPASGPYDAIILQGAVETEPTALLEQLKEGGRLVAIRREGPAGRAIQWRKTASGVTRRAVFDATAPVLPGFDSAPAFIF